MSSPVPERGRRARPRALLLDLDGTLMDSEGAHRAAYERFFAARGWRAPDLSVFTGRRAEDVFATLDGPWRGHDLLALAGEAAAVVRSEDMRRMPGARDLVERALEHGWQLALVTSAGPQWASAALGPDPGLGVLEHFGAVVTAADVEVGKPDPAGYLLACERLGVEPGDCVVVEDSPAGVEAGARAGAGLVVGITTTADPDTLSAAGAGLVVGSLDAVPVADTEPRPQG